LSADLHAYSEIFCNGTRESTKKTRIGGLIRHPELKSLGGDFGNS